MSPKLNFHFERQIYPPAIDFILVTILAVVVLSSLVQSISKIVQFPRRLFLGGLLCQQHGNPLGLICLGNFMSCNTVVEVADQAYYLMQSLYNDTGPDGPSTDPTVPESGREAIMVSSFMSMVQLNMPHTDCERRKASADTPSNPGLFPCPHCPWTCKSRIGLHSPWQMGAMLKSVIIDFDGLLAQLSADSKSDQWSLSTEAGALPLGHWGSLSQQKLYSHLQVKEIQLKHWAFSLHIFSPIKKNLDLFLGCL